MSYAAQRARSTPLRALWHVLGLSRDSRGSWGP